MTSNFVNPWSHFWHLGTILIYKPNHPRKENCNFGNIFHECWKVSKCIIKVNTLPYLTLFFGHLCFRANSASCSIFNLKRFFQKSLSASENRVWNCMCQSEMNIKWVVLTEPRGATFQQLNEAINQLLAE